MPLINKELYVKIASAHTLALTHEALYSGQGNAFFMQITFIFQSIVCHRSK